MGPSPALATARLRTPARPGWRAGVAQSVTAVGQVPSLLLLGALGFMVRGGALLLALPILVLPTPVTLRLLIGDNLGSSGFTAGFYLLVVAAAAVLVGLVVACLAIAAHVEVSAFERLAGRARPVHRGQAARGVFAIELIALATLVAAALPLVAGAASVTHAELVRPTLGAPLYDRVLAQLGAPLYFLLAVLVVVEAASAVAIRRYLASDSALRAPGVSPLTAVLIGLGRPVLRPLTTLGTALLGWLVSLLLLVPALWTVGVAWEAVRAALLGPLPISGGEEVGALIAVLLLCGAWLAALAAAGLASAVRAALWTSEELR
jgi:hypothetical protein